jgi:predicted nucleic-acid-binding Zn-ribbon protein
MAVGDIFGLTEEQVKLANEWFQKHWKPEFRCPICDQQTWQVGTHIILPPTIASGGGVTLEAPTYPYLPVACMTCGYTLFFNAVVMKLWAAYQPLLPVVPKPNV